MKPSRWVPVSFLAYEEMVHRLVVRLTSQQDSGLAWSTQAHQKEMFHRFLHILL